MCESVFALLSHTVFVTAEVGMHIQYLGPLRPSVTVVDSWVKLWGIFTKSVFYTFLTLKMNVMISLI